MLVAVFMWMTFYQAKTIAEIEETLQNNINKLNECAIENGFKLSKTETHCIHLCRLRSPHRDPVLSLEDQTIETRSSIRVLGVMFDSKLN